MSRSDDAEANADDGAGAVAAERRGEAAVAPRGVEPGSSGTTGAIDANSFLTLHYRLILVGPQDVDVTSTFGGNPATLQLGAGQFSPALEERLIGMEVGAHAVHEFAPSVAFGPRSPDLVQRLPKQLLEAESGRSDYSPGDVVEFNAPGGGRYAGVFRSLENDYAIFDFNHPLAGQPVRFEVQILGIL